MRLDWLRRLLTPKDTYRPPVDALRRVIPPWIVRPDWGRGSMGWRMNGGEDLMDRWVRWYTSATPEERVRYQRDYPTPADPELYWGDWYADLDRD